MNFKHTLSALVTSAIVALLVVSCGKKEEEAVGVSSVAVSPVSVEITEGESTKLTAKISPAAAADRTVTWTSSDKAIATVDGSGNVQGIKAGTATITATAEGKSGKCEVTVSAKVTSFSLSETKLNLVEGGNTSIKAIITPEKAAGLEVEWNTSNSKVAVVTNGTIAAIAAGEAVITATLKEYPEFTASCSVTVASNEVKATAMRFADKYSTGDGYAATIRIDEPGQILELVFEPADATNKQVNWSSENTDVLTVDEFGAITPLNLGTSKVTAVQKNGGLMASISVTVTDVPLESISIKGWSTTPIEVNSGTSVEIECEVLPASAREKDWILEVDKSDLAKVNGHKVEFLPKAGDVTVTAKCVANPSIKAAQIYKVTVTPTAIALPAKISITLGDTKKLTPTHTPETASSNELEWASSDDKIVKVDADGTLNAVAKGEATVSVKYKKFPAVGASCIVTVIGESAVSINGGEMMTYEVGHLRDLLAKAGTPITSIKWREGFINSSDAGAIREYCTALESADMKNVRIVSGGDTYKSGFQNKDKYTTTDDEFPPALFYEHNTLKSIILPGYITKIGDRAFESCVLDKVVFPDSGLEIIGKYAFSLNGSLKHSKLYNVPSSIKTIEYYSFYGAYFVDRLYLPNIEDLDNTAFINIVADEIFLGPKLKTQGLGGMEVNQVIIDESHPQIYVTGQAIVDRSMKKVIGWVAGRNHSSVSSLTISAIENVTALGDYLLRNGLYPNCKKITVSEGYTYLDNYSLDTRKFEVLDLPSTLERISVLFVAYNKVLKDVTIRAAVPPTFNDYDGRFDDPFHGCDFKGVIRVPAASLETYKTTKYWSKYADQYVAIE